MDMDGDSSHARKLGVGITCQGEPSTICTYKFKSVTGGCQKCKTDFCCMDIISQGLQSASILIFARRNKEAAALIIRSVKRATVIVTAGTGTTVPMLCVSAIHNRTATIRSTATSMQMGCTNVKQNLEMARPALPMMTVRMAIAGTRQNYECQHNCKDVGCPVLPNGCDGQCEHNGGVCEKNGCRPARCDDSGNSCVNGDKQDLGCAGGPYCYEVSRGRRNGAACWPLNTKYSDSCASKCCRNRGKKDKGTCQTQKAGGGSCYRNQYGT
eukprot:scaffold76281_cov61-Attheya_sp.AAC.6